jgi:hypothetical protein
MDAEHLIQLRQYAWNYFSVHADQRLKTFNFYLVLCTAIVAGILVTAKDATNSIGAASLALLISPLSFIFWKLDQRNHHLVTIGETALKYLEGEIGLADPSSPDILQPFRYEEKTTNALPHLRFTRHRCAEPSTNTWSPCRAHFSYSNCFNAVFFAFGFGGAILCSILLWRIVP